MGEIAVDKMGGVCPVLSIFGILVQTLAVHCVIPIVKLILEKITFFKCQQGVK